MEDQKKAQQLYDAAAVKLRAAIDEHQNRYYDLMVALGKDKEPWFFTVFDGLPPNLKAKAEADQEAKVDSARKRVFG